MMEEDGASGGGTALFFSGLLGHGVRKKTEGEGAVTCNACDQQSERERGRGAGLRERKKKGSGSLGL